MQAVGCCACMSGLLLGWAGGGWTEGYSRLSLALRIQNLMKIHRHTLASIDPCTQIHPRPPAHTLSLAGSHTPARVPVYVPHTGKLIHYTPPHGPHTPFNTHVHPPTTTAHTHTLTGASSPHVLTHAHTHTLHTLYHTHALKHILAHTHTLHSPARTFSCTQVILS